MTGAQRGTDQLSLGSTRADIFYQRHYASARWLTGI